MGAVGFMVWGFALHGSGKAKALRLSSIPPTQDNTILVKRKPLKMAPTSASHQLEEQRIEYELILVRRSPLQLSLRSSKTLNTLQPHLPVPRSRDTFHTLSLLSD